MTPVKGQYLALGLVGVSANGKTLEKVEDYIQTTRICTVTTHTNNSDSTRQNPVTIGGRCLKYG